MKKREFRQLDDAAMLLLQTRVHFHSGSKAAVSRELGVSRAAISQALSRTYPASTAKLRAKIMATFAERISCPHLQRDIAPGECVSFRERKLVASDRDRVKHWQACQACSENPRAAKEQAA